MLSRQEIDTLRANIDKLSTAEQQEVLEAIEELERREHIKRCQDDFLEFCLHMDPEYKVGAHHRKLAALLMSMEDGVSDRLAVSVPPRHGKSMMISTLYPAWYLGKHPEQQIMLISHTADLAVDFGRKVRNIISSVKYGEIFPNVSLAADSKSAGRWNTNHGGQFYATGVGSALAGRGADLCVSPETIVCTKERGFTPAWSVREGEHLHSHHGYAKVHRVMITPGEVEVLIDGAGLSDTHPVWVYGKGWTPAADVDVDDLLWTTNIYDKIRSSLTRGVYHGATKAREVLQQGLQYLGHDVAKVHEPESGKLHILRRGWCKSLRAVARILEFLRRHGGPPITKAYIGPRGRDRGLYPGELPVGGRVPTGQQPAQCSASYGAGQNPVGSSVGTRDRYIARRYLPQDDRYGYDWRRSAGHSEDESQQKTDTPTQYGWLRTRVARWIGRSSEVARVRGQSRGDQEKRLVCKIQACELAASRTLGLLVGVRRVRSVIKRPHEVGVFVNFQVGGDNTFVVDNTILTHNCIIDDPHNEQDILNGNYSVFDKAYEWFTYGARTRLMRQGRIAVVHTRWHQSDLIGRLVKDMTTKEGVDQYEVFEFPAILNEGTDNEKALWPEFFNLDALHRTKASMPLFQWNAQYQQNPTGEAGAIVRRDSWRRWEGESPPVCEYLIMALDAAAEKTNRSDFTAMTVWGVFSHDVLTQGANHIILLHATNERLEFPDLKRLAFERYNHWQPDCFIVERKSSGIPLYQELRRAGVPVQEFTPSRASGDKIMRLNAVADIFRSGMVWYPAGKRWAEEVVEQVAAFPEVEHDDLTDTVSMALARFRQGGFIRLPSDYEEEPPIRMPRYAGYY